MSKLRKSAKGEECTLRLFPHCNHDTATTVLAHLNSPGKGWALKSPDWFAVFACSSCHDIIDGRVKSDIDSIDIRDALIRGLYLTLKRQIEKGLINVS